MSRENRGLNNWLYENVDVVVTLLAVALLFGAFVYNFVGFVNALSKLQYTLQP